MGMRSPYGKRAAICEKFGWSWDYLTHGLPYAIVERMLVDGSWIDYDQDGKSGAIEITDGNADEIMRMLNERNKR